MNLTGMKQICSRFMKLKKNDYIVILLIGVLILIVMMPVGKKSEKTTESKTKEESGNAATVSEDGYEKELEQKLQSILESMDGVGEVRVMITLSDDGTQNLDKDIKESTEYIEKNTVIYDEDDKSMPYVTSTDRPAVEGVFVVAQGGGNPQIDNDISCAVQALFDVAPHKIKIAKMLSREEN